MGFELLLPVILFILTLAIIFLLRSEDARNQRSDLIKKKAQALLKSVEQSQTLFKESAQKLEERISKKIDESNALLGRVDAQLTDLEARSEDLATLQRVLLQYQQSLQQLEETTTQVEQRITAMKTEIATLSNVEKSLSHFDLRFEQFKQSIEKQIADGAQQLQLQHQRASVIVKDAYSQLQQYEKEIGEGEQASLKMIASHHEALTRAQEASLAVIHTQEQSLQQMSAKSTKQMDVLKRSLASMQNEVKREGEEQQAAFALLQSSYLEQVQDQEASLRAIEEEASVRIHQKMHLFMQTIGDEMDQLFALTLSKTDLSFQKMIEVITAYLNELTSRIEEAQSVSELLDSSQRASLLSFRDELTKLLSQTTEAQHTLAGLEASKEHISSSITLMNQQAEQLQTSLATLKERALHYQVEEQMPHSSVVFAMALVDEGCQPLPSSKRTTKEHGARDRAEGGDRVLETQKNKQVEYLLAEQEVILLDDEEHFE